MAEVPVKNEGVRKGQWTKITSSPARLDSCVAAVLEGVIYFIGELDDENYGDHKVIKYSINDKKWTVLDNNGIKGRGDHMAAEHNNTLYLFGGFKQIYSVQKMIVDRNGKESWTDKGLDEMIDTFYGGIVGVWDGNVLVGGGQAFVIKNQKKCYSYSIENNTWTKMADMIFRPGRKACFGQYKRKLYVVAGCEYTEYVRRENSCNTAMQIYDWDKNEWTLGPNIPEGRSHMFGTVQNGKLYCMGGMELAEPDSENVVIEKNPRVFSSRVDVYDIENETWSEETELPKGMVYSCAVSDGEHLFVVGGYSYGVLNSAYQLDFEDHKQGDTQDIHQMVANLVRNRNISQLVESQFSHLTIDEVQIALESFEKSKK